MFSPTPIMRAVTLSEMMDIYDMELGLQLELKAFWLATEAQPSRAFVLFSHLPRVLFGPILQVLQARAVDLQASPGGAFSPTMNCLLALHLAISRLAKKTPIKPPITSKQSNAMMLR